MSKKLTALEKELAAIEELHQKKKAQVKAKIKDAKTREKQLERKRETRRKIIIGALVETDAEIHPDSELTKRVLWLIDKFTFSDIDRELFDLEPLSKEKKEEQQAEYKKFKVKK